MNKKAVLPIALVCAMLFSALVGTGQLGTAQSSVSVSGIISVDTTWTKTNSPYTLTGPTAVGKGVTLTIEAGVNVNLNNYYIQVNGTLIARGTDADKIYFNGGSITFMSSSTSWNEQTRFGCIIEHAIITSTSISSSVSLKLNRNSINAEISVGDASIISNNTIINEEYYDLSGIDEINLRDGSPSVTDNILKGISIAGGSPLISNNTIKGTFNDHAINCGGNRNSPIISNNIIMNSQNGSYYDTSQGFPVRGTQIVFYPGITLSGSNNTVYIIENELTNCSSGIKGDTGSNAIIQKNLFFDNTRVAIDIDTATIEGNNIFGNSNSEGIEIGSKATIQNNTIANNGVYGIKLKYSWSSATIINNNIYGNNLNSIYSLTANNVNATYNWWGTTDAQAINQSIFDFKNDFNLGTVTFIPYLTEPNPEAAPSSNPPPKYTQTPPSSPTTGPIQTFTPTPIQYQTGPSSPNQSPSPSQNPTPSPEQSSNQVSPQTEFSKIAIVVIGVCVAIIVVLVVVVARLVRKKTVQT